MNHRVEASVLESGGPRLAYLGQCQDVALVADRVGHELRVLLRPLDLFFAEGQAQGAGKSDDREELHGERQKVGDRPSLD